MGTTTYSRSKQLSAIRVNSTCNLNPRLIVLIGRYIMTLGSDPWGSSRIWLFVTALGLVAVSTHFPSRVDAQTAQAQTAQTQTPHHRPHREELPVDSVAPVGTLNNVATVHVDVTPEHVLNTIYPDTATGAWMDDLSKTQVDNLSKPETIQGVKNLGWDPSPCATTASCASRRGTGTKTAH